MRLILFSFLIIFLFLIFPYKVYAVDITINSYPASVSSDEFIIDVSVSGATDATNYLRVDLYKDGTSNYFGETYNGTGWYTGSEGINYFPIQVLNSTASATLKAKIGNPSAGEYHGPGLYKLKVRRYTNSGNPAGSDKQTPVDIELTYATPAPTQAPTTQPTNVPTSAPTAKPTPTKSPTARPTLSSTPSSTPSTEPDETDIPTETLGLSVDNDQSPRPTGIVAGASTNKKFPVLATIFLIAGVGCLGYVGYLLYNSRYAKTPEIS